MTTVNHARPTGVDGQASIAQQIDVRAIVVPDLQWGEIDDARQDARVTSMEWQA